MRLAYGLSQAQLAARLGLDRTAVVRIEAGERRVSALELGRLADVLERYPRRLSWPRPESPPQHVDAMSGNKPVVA
ncbi:MAG: helix-turn-helix domain-containing protein [Actinomycetota bacterium]|nr:helix-turn-helix domain-containing protein [Actinomycetota bacterium]